MNLYISKHVVSCLLTKKKSPYIVYKVVLSNTTATNHIWLFNLIKTKQSRKSICPTAVCSQWLPYWLTKMWSTLSTETSLAALGRGCCWILLLWEWSLQDRIGVTLTNDLCNPLTRFVQEMKFTLPAQAACLEAHLGIHRYLGPYQTFSHSPAHELVVNVGLFRKAELLLLCIFFKNKKMRLTICVLHATEQYLMFFK